MLVVRRSSFGDGFVTRALDAMLLPVFKVVVALVKVLRLQLADVHWQPDTHEEASEGL